MDDKQNSSGSDVKKEPYVITHVKPPAVVKNQNQKAHENVRIPTDEPKTRNNESTYGVGSEITDGEDA